MISLKIVRVPSISRQIRKFSVPAIVPNVSKNEPEYPPILDLSSGAVRRRKKEKIYEFVKRQPTVEEKMIAINMPRYYGWVSLLINENQVHYNTLEHAQFITRTHILPEKGLPSFYDNLIDTETLDQIVQNVRSQIEETLILEYSRRNRHQELSPEEISYAEGFENIQTKAVTRQINRILLVELSRKYPHLLNAQIDYDPRVEAFWSVGGIYSSNIIKRKEKVECKGPYVESTISRYFQYIGKPNFQLRHQLLLREIVPYEESKNPQYEVPEVRFDPRAMGYNQIERHGTNIPGFWPGDEQEFGLLSYHNCGYMTTRKKEWDDEEIAPKTQAVRASFAWLHSQACYQGFSTFNDITYPLVTQNIVTNGQWWLFSAYQLNTMLMCDFHIDENPKRNFFWSTNPLQLFEKIEDNKVHGFNDEVLKHLVKMYVNEPQKRYEDLKPFLGINIQKVSDIDDPLKRNWLEREFKHLNSAKSRHRLKPEIHPWQKIYMLKFKTRPLDKKLEPWQKGIDVNKRKLDEHTPKYIPKCKRPYPKHGKKFETTYYPK